MERSEKESPALSSRLLFLSNDRTDGRSVGKGEGEEEEEEELGVDLGQVAQI